MIRGIALASMVSVVVSSPIGAHAQEGAPAEGAAPPARRAPRPFNLSDLERGNTVGGELSYTSSAIDTTDVSSTEIGIVGEYEVAPGIELFARLPWAHGSFSFDGNSQGDDSIGNVSVGARYILGGGENLILAPWAMIYAPTAESLDTMSFSDFATLTAFMSNIVRDPARWFPDAATIRPGFDARFDMGNTYVQGSVSIPMMFYTGEDDLDDEQINLLQGGVGVGSRVTPELAIVGEFILVADAFDEGLADQGDDVFFAIDVGARYDLEKISIGGHFYFPLNEDLRDQEQFGFTFDLFGTL